MDSTIYQFIRTQKLSAPAGGVASEAAPQGVQGVYIYAKGAIHIAGGGSTATTDSAPIGATQPHYIKASQGQVFSVCRGADEAADVDVWLTWVKD